jgi:type I restriction enzyme S subunit
MYILRTPAIRRYLQSITQGVAQRKISLGRFKTVQFPCPPVREQGRIVEALDSHLSRLDAAVESLEAAQKKLKAYRASALKAAVEGRLVPTEAEMARKEGRSFEPAEALLERILEERRRSWERGELTKMKAAGKSPVDDRWKKKYRDPAPPPASTLPSLPQGWCWATLDQLSILVRNGHPAPPRASTGVRTLRISSVRPLAVDFQDVRYLAGRPEDFADDLVDIDDLLFTRYNGTPSLVGVCGRVRFLDRPTVHPDKLIKVRLVSAAASRFIEIAANAGKSRRHVESRTRTTAGQAGISGADLKQMPVPLPPREEQERIWSTVEALLTVEATTRRDIDLALRRCTALRQVLLKAAFEGTLVEQRSDDEPADVLLARIHAERKSAQVTRRKAKRPRKLKAAS